MPNKLLLTAAMLFLAMPFQPALAADFEIEAITAENPRLRATPPGARVTAGYLVIVNAGPEADRLIGGSMELAARTSVHQMKMVDNMMQMRPLEHGLELPAGSSTELKSGGYHLMFSGLTEQLMPGAEVRGTLIFETAGELPIVFVVEKIGSH